MERKCRLAFPHVKFSWQLVSRQAFPQGPLSGLLASLPRMGTVKISLWLRYLQHFNKTWKLRCYLLQLPITYLRESKTNKTINAKHSSVQRSWQDAPQALWMPESEYTEAWEKVIGIFGAINQGCKDLHFGYITYRAGLEGENTLK